MPVWVGLLRGVNVGGRNRVPMAALRDALEVAGHRSRTHLASGNVVLRSAHRSAAGAAGVIAEAVAASSGLEVPVVVRRADQLAAVLDACPFDVPDPTWTHVVFFPRALDPDDVAAMRAVDVGEHRIEVADHEAWVHYAGTSQDTSTQRALARLGPDGTARNWRTATAVRDLAAELA